MTLTSDLGGHGTCGWRGSSSSICRPSLNFTAWAFRKYGAQCVSALMVLVTLTFDLETGMRVASTVGNLPSRFWHAKPLGSWIIHYVSNGRTDKQMLSAPSLQAGA